MGLLDLEWYVAAADIHSAITAALNKSYGAAGVDHGGTEKE